MSHRGREAGPTPSRDAGFALLEVLAAVAIAGFVLSGIGAIVAVTFAGLRSTSDRVLLAETGRTLLDSLPQGDALTPGTTSGTTGTTKWRIEVVASHQDLGRDALNPGTPAGPGWDPAAITISAQTRSGRRLRLDTIGLIRRAPP